jgi:cytochrome c-type biogenesis protein CcmF
MTLAHLGVGVFVLGALLVEATSIEKDVRLKPGETVALGAYTVRFERTTHYAGPNYEADRGELTLLRNDEEITRLHPESASTPAAARS